MKRFPNITIALIAGVAMLAASSVFAAPAYVSSARAKIYSDKSAGSAAVATVTRGTKLNVKSAQGAWVQVNYAGKNGWVKKLFTSSRKPMAKFSILGNASSNALVHARKRASSNVTAASARGLDDDSNSAILGSRGRELATQKGGFDPRALEAMESLFISENELNTFLAQGGLQ